MHRDGLHVVLRVVEELRKRGALLEDFHAAAMSAGTENVRAVLHYLDYVLSKRQAEQDRGDMAGQ